MKILQCHNFYQQPGGEDQVFHDEAHLLREHGHEVIQFTRSNDSIREMSSWQLALRTVWNREASAELRRLIRIERPAIVHFTNTFPLISPAAYYAVHKEGVKVVQSLHNYRLLCPNAQFLRDGNPCELCLDKAIPLPAVRYACYRNDRRASAVVAGMLAFHRALGTWKRDVDLYFALTEFGKQKFIQGGISAGKIIVKPNFISVDPGVGDGSGGYALFVGRLAPEKGIATLLNAWSQNKVEMPLWIVGDGPLANRVREAANQNPRIRWLGFQTSDSVLEIVGSASFLLIPSLWYEGLPKIVVEAFSKGTPVIGSNLGAMAELIDHGRTGMLFSPGDAAGLGAAIKQLIIDAARLGSMRLAARQEFEQKFTAEANYKILMSAYHRVLREPTSGPSVSADSVISSDDTTSAASRNLVTATL